MLRAGSLWNRAGSCGQPGGQRCLAVNPLPRGPAQAVPRLCWDVSPRAGGSPELPPCRSTEGPCGFAPPAHGGGQDVSCLPGVSEGGSGPSAQRVLEDSALAVAPGALQMPLPVMDVLSLGQGRLFHQRALSWAPDRPRWGRGCWGSAVPLGPRGVHVPSGVSAPLQAPGGTSPSHPRSHANASAVPQPKPCASLRQVCHPACH